MFHPHCDVPLPPPSARVALTCSPVLPAGPLGPPPPSYTPGSDASPAAVLACLNYPLPPLRLDVSGTLCESPIMTGAMTEWWTMLDLWCSFDLHPCTEIWELIDQFCYIYYRLINCCRDEYSGIFLHPKIDWIVGFSNWNVPTAALRFWHHCRSGNKEEYQFKGRLAFPNSLRVRCRKF